MLLMPRSILLAFNNIAGRLYLAIGMLFVAVIVTNLLTLGCAGNMVTRAHTVAMESIDSLRAADDFDELLDRHRRIVAAAAESHDPAGGPDAVATLMEIEHEFAASP